MVKYHKILVAIDLSDESTRVLETAVEVRQEHDAELLIAHIIEPVSAAYGGVVMGGLGHASHGSELESAAKEQLTAYVNQHNLETSQQIIASGHPETEIHRLVIEHDIDLVVIGSHGRRGFQRFMLGSTANGVLQGATCDVLAVRVN